MKILFDNSKAEIETGLYTLNELRAGIIDEKPDGKIRTELKFRQPLPEGQEVPPESINIYQPYIEQTLLPNGSKKTFTVSSLNILTPAINYSLTEVGIDIPNMAWVINIEESTDLALVGTNDRTKSKIDEMDREKKFCYNMIFVDKRVKGRNSFNYNLVKQTYRLLVERIKGVPFREAHNQEEVDQHLAQIFAPKIEG